MRPLIGAAIAVAALAGAQPAEARRTVDYSVDDATLGAWADEQGMAPLTPAPAPAHAIRLELKPGLDHEVTRVGIVCSAWTVDNPISALLTRMVPGSATAAMAGPADLTLRVEHAATLSRCFQVAELKARCVTRVTLDGNAVSGGKERPVHAEIERATNSVGACAGLTRGIALVSRDAVIALIAKADAETVAGR